MDAFEIRFSGTGGQGLQLSAKIFAEALNLDGKRVAMSQAYEPTSRGGISRSDLVVAPGGIDYPLATRLDFLIVLDQSAAALSLPLMRPGGTVITDARKVTEPPSSGFEVHALELSAAAMDIGNERVTNIVTLGALNALGALCTPDALEAAISARVPPKFLELNREALARGTALATADAELAAEAG